MGLCTNVLVYNSYQVVSGDKGQIPAPNASLTVLSLNVSKKAEYTTSLRPACNCSMNNPCLNGGTCHQVLPSGCVCECPVQYSTTPNCMKSVVRTFMASQKSYLWIHTLAETDRGALQFDFTTKEPNGLLLYQGPGIYGECIVVSYNVVWCGAVWCGAVWCGVVWCSVVWSGAVWCGVVWCSLVWCGVVWCSVVWCGVVWCGVTWCAVLCCVLLWCGVMCSVVWCGAVQCSVV